MKGYVTVTRISQPLRLVLSVLRTLPVENMVKGKILFIIAVTLFLVFMTQLWRFTSF